MDFVHNPPDASALMMSARSFGNYDLAAALADLIDNSITAKAKRIEIRCLFNDGDPEVRVIDDGLGMDEAALHLAMRPASSNPIADRSPDDLGRFGWGMKSASFSQCKRLTVISNTAAGTFGARWDLDDIDEFRMGVLSDLDLSETSSTEITERFGTEIIWQNCDRLSEAGQISHQHFNQVVSHARSRLALIFHKFLSGEVHGKKLAIRMNGTPIEAADPFYRAHNATQAIPVEPLKVGDQNVEISPFILPHFSKLKLTDHERLGGEEGFLRNQGFYVYRNHRLIIHGTWFRLAKYGELSQLVRIGVDIPNTLDDMWKITIDKSDAQLPAALRNRLKQIVDGLKGKSSRVFRSKGGKIDQPGTVSVWNRYARQGEVRYEINREHPLISQLLKTVDGEGQDFARAAIKAIEQTFPVAAFGNDAVKDMDSLNQTEADPGRFIELLEAAVPSMLIEADGSFNDLAELLRSTDPFASNWPLVQSYLEKKGWFDEQP
ncbi:ATP-binding protein [Ruegeria sp. HKCCA4008]|uniref:ATP-binding protein n=1 Tax=Ruegeria sp. HKCCA4008 TaxID=2682999 RepID=UPI001489E971|nr:ATP-binding protein [Ruegeria sp. HKCCA4008]